jgi:hypothetical protein
MPIRIFQASGHSGINDLEDTINAWLRESRCVVDHLSTSTCQVGEADQGERYQHLTVTILYRPPISN